MSALKRFVAVVAAGLLFSPAVFAGQLDEVTNEHGINCQYARLLKKLPKDDKKETTTPGSRVSVARSVSKSAAKMAR